MDKEKDRNLMFAKIYDRVKGISKKENRQVYISDKVTKLIEEIGEYSAVHLEAIGYKYVQKERSPEEIRKHELEELCDMQIMVLDIFAHHDFAADEIYHMIQKKLNKWESLIDEGKIKLKQLR